MKDNQIISLRVSKQFGKRKYSVIIKDSLRLLPHSLDSLIKAFNIDIPKLNFPYKFAKLHNLDYVGKKPSIDHWNKISQDHYDSIPSDNWSLRTETYKYILNDVRSLYYVLKEFNIEIFLEYRLNINKFLSLPSLALGVFRSSFYLRENIRILRPDIDRIIRKSYYGGIVDVYKPKVDHGYHYDINSLYPLAMTKKLPIGSAKITSQRDLSKIMGFVKANIIAPCKEVLENPVLPVKLDNGELVVPRGQFSGWYYSEELKYAESLGYKITVIEAVEIEHEYVFNEYIDHFYKIKSTTKNPTSKLIAKLFLNSLYGKFGMNIENSISSVVNIDTIDLLLKEGNIPVGEPIALDTNEEIFIFKYAKRDYDLDQPRDRVINVAIASAITAYSRIEISKYKNIPGNPPVYTDTDSIILHKPLDSKLVGTELGQMKLELVVNKGIYISPKIYYETDGVSELKKCKGLGSVLSIDEYLTLYRGDSIMKTKLYFQKN